MWYGALAGILCGFLYLAGATRQYRPATNNVLDNKVGAEESTECAEGFSGIEESWENEVRKALAESDLGREYEGLATHNQHRIYGLGLGIEGQIYSDQVPEAVRDTIMKDPNCWMAHTEEARIALTKGNFDTAIKQIKQAIIVAPEKLKDQLNEIAMQLEKQCEHH